MASPFDDLPPDPVIDFYKKDLDLSLIRENLKRTPEERIRNLMELQRFAKELQRAGRDERCSSGPSVQSLPKRLPK
jgi:hypothetical protein